MEAAEASFFAFGPNSFLTLPRHKVFTISLAAV
jgi:hypothetical protein